jgi:SNF2 family DNA or RNA helicase
MEQIAPGSLGSLKDFRTRYGVPDRDNMAELHDRVFKPSHKHPALALRRTKDQVARDLPEKTRLLHPRLMPEGQASVYDDARLKLAQRGLGAALKTLHHIRSVSVHPSLDASVSGADFIKASARLSAAFDILRRIAAKGERALVFIEHRQMQHRFIELARAEFGLSRIELINGETPIAKRQAIVNRFQRHLEDDRGFDILVLGPKAAGVGLTLTAATHVIHLSRWWNPAVEEQCNDRVHRLGQMRPVCIHLLMAIHPSYLENSFDCLLQSLMQRKRKLASSALWPMGDTDSDVAELQKMLNAEKATSTEDPLISTVITLFRRDGLGHPAIDTDGSVPF